jgi:hypothetical protein
VTSSVVVDAPLERAFSVFTQDMADWWPPEHHILQAKLAEIVFEPREGGNIYDRGVEVRFIAEAHDRTRVELEHRAIERHGEGWEQMRDAVGSAEGWDKGLRGFAAHVKTLATAQAPTGR